MVSVTGGGRGLASNKMDGGRQSAATGCREGEYRKTANAITTTATERGRDDKE